MNGAPLPDFTEFGLLPPGVHACNEDSFRVCFVEKFQDSVSRAKIFEGFCGLRSDAMRNRIIAVQWVDGSFVEKKEPRDIDVVTFVDYTYANSLSPDAQEFILQILNGKENSKPAYSTHSFFAASCSQGHPYYDTYEKTRRYWRKWFGTTRPIRNTDETEMQGRPKGFVQLNLGNERDVPQVSTAEVSL